jgi:hypothetical protein
MSLLSADPFTVKTPKTALRSAEMPPEEVLEPAEEPLDPKYKPQSPPSVPDSPGMQASLPSHGQPATMRPPTIDGPKPAQYPRATPVAPPPSMSSRPAGVITPGPTDLARSMNQIPDQQVIDLQIKLGVTEDERILWENKCLNARAEAEKYRDAYHILLVKQQPDMEVRKRLFEWEQQPVNILRR